MKRTETEPRWSKVARTWSPAWTVMAAGSAPGRMASPAWRVTSKAARVLASQATAWAGLPRTAEPVALLMSSPFFSDHAGEAKIERIGLDGAAADDHAAGGGVVGDRIGELDLPVGDSAID